MSFSHCKFNKYYLSNNKSQCIDGTVAVFYFRKGFKEGINKFHIHFEGGGWCYDKESCDYRSTTELGSSKHYPDCLIWETLSNAYFNTNELFNPLLYNFNTVYVRYCDGSSFAGNSIQTHQVIICLFMYLIHFIFVTYNNFVNN